MKVVYKIVFLIFLLLIFYGCTPKVYTVGQWEIGKVINPQFVEKVIMVENYKFETYVRHPLGYVAPFNKVIVKGEISDCLISELKGVLPGYAVVKDLKEINPNAEIIRVKPVEVDFKGKHSQRGFIARIKVEIQNKDKVETISAEGEGKGFTISLTQSCENIASKMQKINN
ncbi:MAG: hypothetical protein QMD43_06595 [Thermodesulfovibrio sp.]|uniref:hypothetical protein n=1 Tax=Thermodesulfovibrio sp. N1 TaxID=1871110 RepID=UPI00083A20DD|nr:hypothetical protein [Thermodesulfovibrio sp. N1]MDI6714676.1 hypothetical protein [Thermodesulfovibrio sp.]ODA44125.1 hypothetical protein THER_1151 [Thermodesulfovibrio sp. N1]